MHRYVFLASAIAGRKLLVQLSAKDDAQAFSDGHTITLPAPNSENTPEIDPVLQVAAQALLIAAGSLDAGALRTLLGQAQSAQRYVYLEVLRASQLFEHRLPWSFSQHPELRNAQPLSNSVAASLALAMSTQTLPAPPAWFGTVRPLFVLRHAVSEKGLAGLLSNPVQQQGQRLEQPPPQFDEDEKTGSSRLLKLLQNPFSSGNPLSGMLNDILGTGIAKGKQQAEAPEGGGAELPVGRVERTLRRGARAVLSKLSIELPELDNTATHQALRYPEWDIHSQSYRRDWVHVQEVEAWHPDGPRNTSDLGDVLRPPSPEWRRQLAQLGLDHEMHRRQNDGSELDIGALMDCAIDIHTGHPPSSLNIYRASYRTRRDLGVVIALDISGSTGEQNQAGPSVFAQQLSLAYQLAYTLDALGDTVALFGFHSWGRKLVNVVRLKGHEERWSARISERLAQLEPAGYTRTGAAIRHGNQLLCHSMRLPNRLLVLITDGIAYDQDYEQRQAEADTRKALEEARAAGTACVCINIGTGTDTVKLSEVFGAANILAVDEVSEIRPRISKVFRQALLAVSQRRLSKPTSTTTAQTSKVRSVRNLKQGTQAARV